MIYNFIRQYRLASILITIIILGFIGYITYIGVSRIGKQPVDIYLVPSDATLTVNGQKMSAGTTYLKPGSYTVNASKDGFASYKSTVVVGQPNTATIDIALEGVSPEAVQWEKDNQTLYLAREGRAGKAANQAGEQFSAQNPITSDLPYDSPLYTIGYQDDQSDPSGNSIIITIDAAGGARNAAIEQIRAFGYDPTNFKIEFRNYTSPFSHE